MHARTFAVTMLATLLPVLALASSAWAECAWVLWAFFPLDNSYAQPQAFDSAQKCARGIVEAHKTYRWAFKDSHVQETMYTPYKGQIVVVFDDGSKPRMMETNCLPDTVDPREPKGK